MYDYDIFVQGVPGKSDTHGGLGWSTITILTSENYNIIVDTGSFGVRKLLLKKLAEKNLTQEDITHVLLTHTHWDHSVNWTLFPNAEIIVSEIDMEWALEQPVGTCDVPELYIEKLNKHNQLRLIGHDEEVLPNIVSHYTKGHTPGHITYEVRKKDYSLIFSGDAIKNKAELLSNDVDMTMNLIDSKKSIQYIWNMWKAREGNILIPGHDLPIVLIDNYPTYSQSRKVEFQFWLSDSLDEQSRVTL